MVSVYYLLGRVLVILSTLLYVILFQFWNNDIGIEEIVKKTSRVYFSYPQSLQLFIIIQLILIQTVT